MELQSPTPESVTVVLDANRSKVRVDALDWAIKHVVRPRDTIFLLGVLSEVGKKRSSSCFPFHMGISVSSISVKIEFSGHIELSPVELEEEIERKRGEFQRTFHPFYRQCKKNEIRLDVKLAAGYDPRIITILEARKCNPRWIILDSNLKKHKMHIYGHVQCKVAVMKCKGVATLMPSRTPHEKPFQSQTSYVRNRLSSGNCHHHQLSDSESIGDVGFTERALQEMTSGPPPTPGTPCWYPLSWRTGYPRAFSLSELESITNGFAGENVINSEKCCGRTTYKGICEETPVLIKCFLANDNRFWSILKILSRVRHRNILNLVGYCSAEDSVFFLYDYPCSGTIEMNLLCEKKAAELSWSVRWCIATEIGMGMRYLHEECIDGPIADLSVSSSSIVLSHGSTAMLAIFSTAKWLRDDAASDEQESLALEDERILADIYDYGLFLIELITGKTAQSFQAQGTGQTLMEWALPFLEERSLDQLMDRRVVDTSDMAVVSHMASTALHCIRSATGQKVSMSEVLAIVRGDQFAVTSS
ncbi:Non-specific serine/threonine protein kinase [Bertholletia excelsa]